MSIFLFFVQVVDDDDDAMDNWIFNMIYHAEKSPMAANLRAQGPVWAPTGPMGEALIDAW